MLENLPFDVLVRVSSFLKAEELMRILMTNKGLHKYRLNQHLWQLYLKYSCDATTLSQLWDHFKIGTCDGSGADTTECIEIARQISAIQSINVVEWRKASVNGFIDKSLVIHSFHGMEAHTMNLYHERFLVIIEGWGRNSTNRLHLLDSYGLPTSLMLIATRTVQPPRFRYGFTTLIYGERIIVFGGLRQGGYSADCNGKQKLM